MENKLDNKGLKIRKEFLSVIDKETMELLKEDKKALQLLNGICQFIADETAKMNADKEAMI